MFRGGLADYSEATTRLHTAAHLLYKSLRLVLGDHALQRGGNVTTERGGASPYKVTLSWPVQRNLAGACE